MGDFFWIFMVIEWHFWWNLKDQNMGSTSIITIMYGDIQTLNMKIYPLVN